MFKTNQQRKETMTKLSHSAQVNKLLKKKAKELGLTVTGSSKNYSMGCSVTVKVLKGSDDAFNKLKEYSYQFKYGSFDGMNDIYNNDNVRNDIPQTKYLFINDDRAVQIIESFDKDIFKTEKKWMWFDNQLAWYEWLKEIKKEYQSNWQEGLKKAMQGEIQKYKILAA